MSHMKNNEQALAMAYAIRRKAMKKKAEGSNQKLDPEMESEHSSKDLALKEKRNPKMMAEGGIIESEDMTKKPDENKPMGMSTSSEPKGIVSRIIGKRMAKGGMVDDEPDADEDVFLTADMPASKVGSEHGYEDEDSEQHAPPERRKKMLEGIMASLIKKHMGR